MNTTEIEIKDNNQWFCRICGHDESWFDRSIDLWEDKHGVIHESGPYIRCSKCGEPE